MCSDFLYKSIYCGYSFELPRQVYKSICCGYSFDLPQLVKSMQFRCVPTTYTTIEKKIILHGLQSEAYEID